MSKKIIGRGHIDEEGKIHLHIGGLQRAQLIEVRGDVKNRNVIYTIERETRSKLQNALLWSWNTTIAEDTGNTPEDVHEHCKKLLNRKKFTYVDKATGELCESTIAQSTAKLSKDAFSEYLELFHAYWTERGYILLWPDETENGNKIEGIDE